MHLCGYLRGSSNQSIIYNGAACLAPCLTRSASLRPLPQAKLMGSGFKSNVLTGTWIESFWNSELTISVQEFTTDTAADRSKYAATISGKYKNGAGSIDGLLLVTRKSAQGVWREDGNEGLFQFDVVEDGLVFCGPYYHQGKHMGTWCVANGGSSSRRCYDVLASS